MNKESTIRARRTPKQKRSHDMVDVILDATAQVLMEEGYEKATTNRIAAKAGVSIGSLYQYFPNKEALVLELNNRYGRRELMLLKSKFQKISDAPLPVAIRELIKAMVDLHSSEPKLHKVLVEQVPRIGDRERIKEIDDEIHNLIKDSLMGRNTPTSPEELDMIIFVIFNIVETLTHQAVLYHEELLKNDRLTDEISSLVALYLNFKANENENRNPS